MILFFSSFISLQVVNALTDIEKGNTCDIRVRDYSPARSYSSYSESEIDESEDEMQVLFECEAELQSNSSESTTSNSIIQMGHMLVRQPPSPPFQSISSSSSSSMKIYAEPTGDCEALDEENTEISECQVELLNS